MHNIEQFSATIEDYLDRGLSPMEVDDQITTTILSSPEPPSFSSTRSSVAVSEQRRGHREAVVEYYTRGGTPDQILANLSCRESGPSFIEPISLLG